MGNAVHSARRLVLLFAVAAGATLAPARAQHLGPGTHEQRLPVHGRVRAYLVHVPPGYDRDRPTPVVLAFHGGGSNPRGMMTFCGLNEKADAEGFIVVYPAGTGRRDRRRYDRRPHGLRFR